jgi:hypothetical protein
MPGVPVPGGGSVLPLVWDGFSDIALGLVNTGNFVGFRGVLDAAGKGSARFDTLGTVPSSVVGEMVYFASILVPAYTVSNAVAVDIRK